jgi:hypothetical protein
MAAEGKVPVLESAKAGYAFMRGSLRAVAPAAALAAAVSALTEVAADTNRGPLMLVVMLGFFAVSLAFTAFTLRLALNQDATGFFGLKAGQDEANLAGATVVAGFFYFIVAIPCFVAFMLAVGMAATRAKVSLDSIQGDPEAAAAALASIFAGPDAPMIWVVLLAVLVLLLWLMSRLSLASVATVGERRVMVFSTWEWTRGNAWRLLAATMLVILPLMFAVTFISGFVSGLLGVTPTPEGMKGPFAARAFVQLLQGFGQFLFVTPAISGLMVHLYRGLRPPNWTPPPAKS